jgi:hypothetical protein
VRVDLFGDPPSDVAWQAVQRLAREEHPDTASAWLAAWLTGAAERLSPAHRESILAAISMLITPDNENLLKALLARPESVARYLALAALAELPVLTPAVLVAARAALNDRSAPDWLQERIVATVLRTLPSGKDRLPARVLRWFLQGRDTKSALRRLRMLQKRVGPHPLLSAAMERRQPRAKLECPRCRVRLPREQMKAHLWQTHQLLLDGLSVRDAWEILDNWAHRARREPIWRERCRTAAFRLDPDNGLTRADRLLLIHKAAEPEVRSAWLRQARERHAAVCPHCYALVPVPPSLPPWPVNLRPERLSAAGYEVLLDERGRRPRLQLATPRGALSEETLPELTPMGAVFALCGPLILLANLLAFFWPWKPLGVVLLVLLAAVLLAAFTWLLVQPNQSTIGRLIGLTWARLVPRLFPQGFDADDARFVAGLARLTSQREYYAMPEAQLHDVFNVLLAGLESRRADPEQVAAVGRLVAECHAQRGADPVALVEKWIARAFDGRMPLSFAEHLFADWQTDFWTPGQLARLRLRVLDRAFEAGFEVQGLLDAGQNAPALGEVLGVDAPRRLAALRLLWSMRAARPWDRLGNARTAFEIAAVPSRIEILERHPDVLLWYQEGTPIMNEHTSICPAEIQLTLAGLWIGSELFATPPRVYETRRRGEMHELTINRVRFRSPKDIEPLTRTLERWFRFAFYEFLPNVDRVREWVSPSRDAALRAWGAVPCPECNRYLLPRVGELGLALTD